MTHLNARAWHTVAGVRYSKTFLDAGFTISRCQKDKDAKISKNTAVLNRENPLTLNRVHIMQRKIQINCVHRPRGAKSTLSNLLS